MTVGFEIDIFEKCIQFFMFTLDWKITEIRCLQERDLFDEFLCNLQKKKKDNSAELQGIMHDQAFRPSHLPSETFQSVIEMFDI